MEPIIPTSPITIPATRSTTPPSPSSSIHRPPPPQRERYDIENHIPPPPFVPNPTYTPAALPGHRPSPASIPERLGRTSYYNDLGFGEFAELLATGDHLDAAKEPLHEETLRFYNVVPTGDGTPRRRAGDGYRRHMNATPDESPSPPEVRVVRQKGIWSRVRRALRRPVFLWGMVRRRKPRRMKREVLGQGEEGGGYLTPPNGERTPSVRSEAGSTEGVKSLLVGEDAGERALGNVPVESAAAEIEANEGCKPAGSDRDAVEPIANRLSTLSIECTGEMCMLTKVGTVVCFMPAGTAKEPELPDGAAADIDDNPLALKPNTPTTTISKHEFPTSESSEHAIIISAAKTTSPVTATTPINSPTTDTFTDALEALDECRDLVAPALSPAPRNARRYSTRRRGCVFNLNRSNSGSGRMTLFPDGVEEVWQKELEDKMGTSWGAEVKEAGGGTVKESVVQEPREDVKGTGPENAKLKWKGKEVEKKEVIDEDEGDKKEWDTFEGYKRDTWGNGVIAL